MPSRGQADWIIGSSTSRRPPGLLAPVPCLTPARKPPRPRSKPRRRPLPRLRPQSHSPLPTRRHQCRPRFRRPRTRTLHRHHPRQHPLPAQCCRLIRRSLPRHRRRFSLPPTLRPRVHPHRLTRFPPVHRHRPILLPILPRHRRFSLYRISSPFPRSRQPCKPCLTHRRPFSQTPRK